VNLGAKSEKAGKFKSGQIRLNLKGQKQNSVNLRKFEVKREI